MLVFLAGPAGLVFIVTVLAVVTFNIVIMYLYRKHRARQTQRFLPTLILNLRTIVPAVATAKMFIRVFTVNTLAGPMFANTLLVPRSCESVAARSRAILAQGAAQGSDLIYDREIGLDGRS